jgi:hypothetical protein
MGSSILLSMAAHVHIFSTRVGDQRQAYSHLPEGLFNASKYLWHKGLRSYNYVYCTKTNEATRAPQEVCDEAQFLEFTCPLLFGPHRNLHWILTWTRCPFIFPTTAQRLLISVALRQFTSARQGMGQRGQRGHLPSQLLAIFDTGDHLQRFASWAYYTNRTAKF